VDLLHDLKSDMYEKYPSTKGYFESASFQYARVIFMRRMKLNLTQKELAEHVGVSLESITRAEAGSGNIIMEAYDKIFHALNMTIKDVSRAIMKINEADD